MKVRWSILGERGEFTLSLPLSYCAVYFKEVMEIKELEGVVLDFSERRPSLRAYNNQPLVLTLALIREATELSEAEQFGLDMGSEVADVFIYLAEICHLHNIDIVEEVIEKVMRNESRLPEDDFQGGDFATAYINLKKKNGERK